MASRIIFRDSKGRFVSPRERYQKASTVQVRRLVRGKLNYYTVVEHEKFDAEMLAVVLRQDEFESLPPTYEPFKAYIPKGKYAAWEASGQIDKTKGLRGSLVRVTMQVQDGKRTRMISFMHRITRKHNQQAAMFYHMNEVLGNNNMYLYNKFRNKLLTDRVGRQVRLTAVALEKVEV